MIHGDGNIISATKKYSCRGEYKISLEEKGRASANAIQGVTSGVSFDQKSGQARTDKPVTFHWPAGDGRAVGAHYDSNDGTMSLERDVELKMSTPSPTRPEKPKTAPEQAPQQMTPPSTPLQL